MKVDRLLLKGNSDVLTLYMVEDNIADDFVFMKRTSQARPDDVVIALIEGEATCKRYYPEEDYTKFQPANAAMKPIYVRREAVLLGCVVSVYRRL